MLLNVIIAQSCVSIYAVNRLTYHSANDYWGAWTGSVFNERTPQSLYLVGDTVHILWTRSGYGNRYNRSLDRGITWNWCTGSDCHGKRVLNYGWESSIVARHSRVFATAYCWDCSPSSYVPFNRFFDGGNTWMYDSISSPVIFWAYEYGGGPRNLDSPAMDATSNGDTILLVVDAYGWGIRVKRSFDAGSTWGPDGGIVVASPSYTGERHPQISYNLRGRWFVCYTDYPYIKVTYSDDYGSTWATPINLDTLLADLVFNSCHVSSFDNYVSVVWFDKKGNAVNVYYRESRDGGITWTPKENLSGLTLSSDTAAGATVYNHNGIVYVVWFEKSSRSVSGEFDIMQTCKAGHDSSWYPIQNLSNTTGRSLWPMVVYDLSRRFAVVCWQDNNPGNYEIYCSTLAPLLGDGELKVDEDKIEKNKDLVIKGNEIYSDFDVEVFSPDGRLIYKGKRVNLGKGIYFVKMQDGKVQKVILK